MKLFSTILIFLLFSCTLLAQQPDGASWQELKADPNASFFDVRYAFYAEWKDKPYEKGKGYKQFKRWERIMELRVDQNGHYDPEKVWRNYAKYVKKHNKKGANNAKSGGGCTPTTANWTALGPIGPPEPPSRNNNSVGRIDCFAFHPTDTNTIWAGSPTGGLWKSTDYGQTWSTNTDGLNSLGVSDVEYDPNNANIMYMATGDRDSGDTPCIGLLKSTDGGDTWNPSGLTGINRLRKIIVNPATSSTLLVASSTGVQRSTNSGGIWTNTQAGNFYDIAFKPGDPSVVYAATTNAFYKSTDGGATFNPIGITFNTGGVSNIAIGVSPANGAYVYIACYASSSSGGLEGLYLSTNSGASFNFVTNSPYMGFQGWYDWCMAVSPTDINEVYIGAVSLRKTTDGGTTWDDPSTSVAGNIHVDIHALDYQPGNNRLYCGNDGGINRYMNAPGDWDNLNETLVISQGYRTAISESDANVLGMGTQDNGYMLYDSGTWMQELIGDGMESLIDPGKPEVVYAAIQNGYLRKSIDNGGSWYEVLGEAITGEDGAWTTPYAWHPGSRKIMYAGYESVWKSVDAGETWNTISGQLTTGTLRALAVAPSNPDYIYTSDGLNIYVTTNGGGTWNTHTQPLGFNYTTDITISDLDPATAWVCTSSGSVHRTATAGAGAGAWTDISGTLPGYVGYDHCLPKRQ